MIHLHPSRDLRMVSSLQLGRGAFVSAASALVRAGGEIYVAADDEAHLAVFASEAGATPGRWMEIFGEDLPPEKTARQRLKPDFEAAFFVPESFGEFSGIWVLPSGSLENRHRGVAVRGTRVDVLSTKGFYDELLSALKKEVPAAMALSRLNIEGAALIQDQLWLFNRGNEGPGVNAVFVCEGRRAFELLLGSAGTTAGLVNRIWRLELGARDGLPLSLTDACPLDGTRAAFAAAAEETDDAVEDGVVAGSAIGILNSRGEIEAMDFVAGALKIEGLEVTPRPSGEIEILAVQDADDPSKPSQFLVGVWRP